MLFEVMTLGERVRSPQTGGEIVLPGRKVADIRVETNFGDTELTEGSIATIVEGSLEGVSPEQLVVRYRGGK
jgi:hypothetical protein